MSYINCLQDLLTASQKAFFHNWSLSQREIELEFQVHKNYKSLQNSLGNSLSLDLKLLFPLGGSKNQILLLKYYDNNTTGLDNHESFISMLEKYALIKFLLSQHILLVKKEIDSMDFGFIEEIFLTQDQKAFLDCQWNRGNFFFVLFELDEQFNFSLIVEILKIWTTFNGHIKFKARYVPLDILEALGFLVNNPEISDFVKALSCPFARFPINIETEALMEETFYSFGYRSSQECYFETQEYFMNLQTIQDSLVSFKTEFNLKENSLFGENLAALDIISGLYLDRNAKNHKGSHNILTVVYQDRRPLLSSGAEIGFKNIVNSLLKNILCKLFEERWNLKIVAPAGVRFGKIKTMADCYQIIPAGIVVPSTLQILIFVNLSLEPEEFLEREKEIYDVLYGILSKRMGEIMDILCENEVYLTKKLRSCMEVPDYYVPKLTTSLAKILINFKDHILANNEAPKVQEMLRQFDNHHSQEKIEEDLKQGFYMALMSNKFRNNKNTP